MTPRSRKPVIIGGMRGLATDTYHPNFIDFQMDDEIGHSFEYCQNTPDLHRTSLHRSKSENSLLCRSPVESTVQAQLTTELIPPPSATLIKSTSDETLSTPFRYTFDVLSLSLPFLFSISAFSFIFLLHFLFFFVPISLHLRVFGINDYFFVVDFFSLFSQEIFIQPKFTNDNTC